MGRTETETETEVEWEDPLWSVSMSAKFRDKIEKLAGVKGVKTNPLKGTTHKHTGKVPAGRCSYDEYKMDMELRAQEEVKREVISELKQSYKQLLSNEQVLMKSLLETQALLSKSLDALRVYRTQYLDGVERKLELYQQENSHCLPGCTRHKWDTVKGWQRVTDK